MHNVFDPNTLRGRLGLAYAAALVAALAVFACAAVFVVDRAQRDGVDGRLHAIGDAVGIVGDVRAGHLEVDAGDRAQFHTIVGAKAQSAILAPDGTVLVASDDRAAAALAPLANAGAGAHFFDARVASEDVRAYVAPMIVAKRDVGIALAWTDSEAIEALDRQVALGFAFGIPLVAFVATVAGSLIARRGLAPLERIAALAGDIEAHDLNRRLDLPERRDELGRLAATFDRMLDRLQRAFDRERRFTSDASHEIRAPLSVIRAEADLALRGTRTPAEYKRALETIAAEADALESLARDLLAAARAESGGATRECDVDLAEVASAVAGRVALVAAGKRVSISAGGPPAHVIADPQMIERAVMIAVDNAVKYSAEGGNVAIAVSADGATSNLVVTDDGPGFSAQALERAFDRFWRDEEARSSDGTGLGLAIAKTIVEHYGGRIALANGAASGASVRFSLPAADSAAGRR